MENEVVRVWGLVHELSEQLAENQRMANALRSQASILKVRPPTARATIIDSECINV